VTNHFFCLAAIARLLAIASDTHRAVETIVLVIAAYLNFLLASEADKTVRTNTVLKVGLMRGRAQMRDEGTIVFRALGTMAAVRASQAAGGAVVFMERHLTSSTMVPAGATAGAIFLAFAIVDAEFHLDDRSVGRLIAQFRRLILANGPIVEMESIISCAAVAAVLFTVVGHRSNALTAVQAHNVAARDAVVVIKVARFELTARSRPMNRTIAGAQDIVPITRAPIDAELNSSKVWSTGLGLGTDGGGLIFAIRAGIDVCLVIGLSTIAILKGRLGAIRQHDSGGNARSAVEANVVSTLRKVSKLRLVCNDVFGVFFKLTRESSPTRWAVAAFLDIVLANSAIDAEQGTHERAGPIRGLTALSS